MQEEASRPDAHVRLVSVGRLGMSSVLRLWEELISRNIQNKGRCSFPGLWPHLTGPLLHGGRCAKSLVGEEGGKR